MKRYFAEASFRKLQDICTCSDDLEQHPYENGRMKCQVSGCSCQRFETAPYVFVQSDSGRVPLRHHVRHSPDGFGWGYGGSGPSELARCLFIDVFGGERVTLFGITSAGPRIEPASGYGSQIVTYMDFKTEHVALWPQDEGFSITDEDIKRYVVAKVEAARRAGV